MQNNGNYAVQGSRSFKVTDFRTNRKLILELSSEDHPPCKISFRSDHVGGLGIPSLPLLGFCLCRSFLFWSPRHAHRSHGGPILTTYTPYNVFLPKDVPFGGFVDMPPHLGGQIPQKTFRFSAKLLKSKNMHIITTTASVPTKFCTAIKTTKCPSWVVETHTSQIQ